MRQVVRAFIVGFVLSAAAASVAVAQDTPAAKAAPAVVNLNTASVDQLAALPGIGEKTAQRILEHRQKNGPFKKPEDLMNIKGIGEKNCGKLEPLVTPGDGPKGASR